MAAAWCVQNLGQVGSACAVWGTNIEKKLEVGSSCAVWGTAQAAHCGGRQGHTRADSRGDAHSSTSPQ